MYCRQLRSVLVPHDTDPAEPYGQAQDRIAHNIEFRSQATRGAHGRQAVIRLQPVVHQTAGDGEVAAEVQRQGERLHLTMNRASAVNMLLSVWQRSQEMSQPPTATRAVDRGLRTPDQQSKCIAAPCSYKLRPSRP